MSVRVRSVEITGHDPEPLILYLSLMSENRNEDRFALFRGTVGNPGFARRSEITDLIVALNAMKTGDNR